MDGAVYKSCGIWIPIGVKITVSDKIPQRVTISSESHQKNGKNASKKRRFKIIVSTLRKRFAAKRQISFKIKSNGKKF